MWKFVLWICVAGWGWGGILQTRATMLYNMDNITSLTDSDLDDVNDLMVVNYSSPRIASVRWKPPNEFDMRAMGPLYNASYVVIDVIARKQAYPSGMISVSDGHVYVSPLRKEWPRLLYHYAGVAVVTSLVALVIILLPLSGLIWSCCSVCRKRRRRRPYDRKYDNCRKGILTLLFIGLLTAFLFGVVCTFATESQLEQSAAGAAGVLRRDVLYAREYLNVTQLHAAWLLTTNYNELHDRLLDMLDGLGFRAALRLGEATRVSAVARLGTLVAQLGAMREDLLAVHNLTQALRTRADLLNAGLRKVKNQLLQTLAKCDQPKCIALQNKYEIGKLDTEIHYSQMPDVTEMVTKVSSLLDTNIKEELAQGEKVLVDIQYNIQRSVTRNIPGIMKSLNETGLHLADLAVKVGKLSEEASAELGKINVAADEMQQTYEAYGAYRQYVGMGTATILLLILCVLVWGLMCGVCGKRPDVYGISDCCNKATGTKSLYCGVALIFGIGWVVAVVFVVYLLFGVAAQRFVCDPLVEPRQNRLFADLERLVDLEHAMYKVHTNRRLNLASVMVMCHQNKTLYEVLQLDRVLDVDLLKKSLRTEMEEQLRSLRPALTADGDPLVILRPEARAKLVRLAEAGLDDFDFDRILSALETNMTTMALESLSRQLESTASSLQPALRHEALELRAAAADLARLNHQVLAPMVHDANTLNETALRLRESRRWFGQDSPHAPGLPSHPDLPELPPPPDMKSVEEMVSMLVQTTEDAERLINKKGRAMLNRLMEQYAGVVKTIVDDYLQRVRQQAMYQVGHCGPLSAIFNNTRDIACHNILMPINGYWMSLGWCMLLYIPIMVVAVKLARLYLHADPYPGPLVEAAYKVEKRCEREGREGRGRGRETEARGVGGGAGGARSARPDAVATPLDTYHARRYNDMAPKNWEEGPPRYHGPTEYERPPPYYYPGPNDRQ